MKQLDLFSPTDVKKTEQSLKDEEKMQNEPDSDISHSIENTDKSEETENVSKTEEEPDNIIIINEEDNSGITLETDTIIDSAVNSQNEITEEKDDEPQKIIRTKKQGRKALKELAVDPEVIQLIDSTDFSKQYYSISEVADMFKVNASQIRFWENEFEVLKPKKNKKGDRLFRPEDIHNLRLIYHLLRDRKYTLEGAKKKIKEGKKEIRQNFEMTQSLTHIKQFLIRLKENL